MTYIVKDWAGNTMNWGEFDTEDDALVTINFHVMDELESEGLMLDEPNEDGNDFADSDFDEYCGKYEVSEL